MTYKIWPKCDLGPAQNCSRRLNKSKQKLALNLENGPAHKQNAVRFRTYLKEK
jgi:hypothetical protein